MERTPIGGQGLFSGAGLTADNTQLKIEHGELFETKENWYPNLEFPKDEVFHVEESEFKFPPDPPNFTQENSIVTKGPWWKELLASPVKRLRLSHIGSGWRPIIPKLELPPAEEPSVVERKKKAKERRKDLPKRKSANTLSKPCLRSAVKLAKAKGTLNEIVARVEEDFCANSSRASKSSKRRAVDEILKAGGEGYPLTPFALKLLVGTLRESGYKSTSSYLVEAKLEHVERGHNWSSLLDRDFRLCMTAAKRGMGPRKKAAEVPEDVWSNHSLLEDPWQGNRKVGHASHLFACGVHWMMREIEISGLSSEDVRFDPANRMVTLVWRESKKDTDGLSLSRTLQCLCVDGCDLKCPYAVMESLVNHATLRGTEGGFLAACKYGRRATKAEVVKDWKAIYGTKVTGHSARRSGALQYIRKGWAVIQAGYLGRWKSNVIMEYAQEALESLAINNTSCFGGDSQMQLAQQLIKGGNEMKIDKESLKRKADLDVVNKLKAELELFKFDSKESKGSLEKAIKEIENNMCSAAKYLPNLVKSARQQVVHANAKTLLYAPPNSWRTKCGWYYYASNYEFEEGPVEKVTCAKCQSSAH